MNPDEAERRFLDDLDRINRSATSALYPLYYAMAFDEAALSDPSGGIIASFKRDFRFWYAVHHAWQCAYIAGLGRAYDKGSDTLHLGELIKFARTYRGIFDRGRLRDRVFADARKQGNDEATAAQNADKFVRELPPVTDAFFEPLERERVEKGKLYRATIEPVRHRFVAHLAADPSDALDLFKVTPTEQLIGLLEFPLQFHQALWTFYYSGAAPVIRPFHTLPRTEIRAEMLRVARALAGRS